MLSTKSRGSRMEIVPSIRGVVRNFGTALSGRIPTASAIGASPTEAGRPSCGSNCRHAAQESGNIAAIASSRLLRGNEGSAEGMARENDRRRRCGESAFREQRLVTVQYRLEYRALHLSLCHQSRHRGTDAVLVHLACSGLTDRTAQVVDLPLRRVQGAERIILGSLQLVVEHVVDAPELPASP